MPKIFGGETDGGEIDVPWVIYLFKETLITPVSLSNCPNIKGN